MVVTIKGKGEPVPICTTTPLSRGATNNLTHKATNTIRDYDRRLRCLGWRSCPTAQLSCTAAVHTALCVRAVPLRGGAFYGVGPHSMSVGDRLTTDCMHRRYLYGF